MLIEILELNLERTMTNFAKRRNKARDLNCEN